MVSIDNVTNVNSGSEMPWLSLPCTLREEPSQMNVILELKLLTAKLSPVCTVYKQ